MHFPLLDMQVEKNKPYYIEHAMGRELIASFTTLDRALAPYVSAIEAWFDWKLRNETNFEEFVELSVDKMLMYGVVPVRVYWDVADARVVFEALDPTRVIVPEHTRRIEDADWIVVSMEFSQSEYKRRKFFNQDEDFVKRISGRGTDTQEQQDMSDTRRVSEGITHSSDKDRICVWELYVQGDNGWVVYTYSPVCPEENIRPPRGLPYTMGEFRRGLPPFATLSYEGRNEDYMSSRGIAQKIAPFESSLCADWNAQKDWQQLTSSPLFSAQNGLPNNSNIKFVPGQILPFAVQAVQFPPPPLDLAQSMSQTRGTAEQLIGTPDFALGQDAQTGQNKGAKTATEVQTLSAVMGAGIGMRGRRFRREESQILSLAWSLYLQYAKESLGYYFRGEILDVPAQALSEGYVVRLRGTGEDLRQFRMQKAGQRMQILSQNPMVNQRELLKSYLEEDDPSLVPKVLLDQDVQAQDQAEDQALEVAIMEQGYLARVKPTDNHEIHLQILGQWVTKKMQGGEGDKIKPEVAVNAAAHAQAHFQFLQQANPQMAQQLAPAMREFQELGQDALRVIEAQKQQALMQQLQQLPPEQRARAVAMMQRQAQQQQTQNQ
jgi:hypothetical protein